MVYACFERTCIIFDCSYSMVISRFNHSFGVNKGVCSDHSYIDTVYVKLFCLFSDVMPCREKFMMRSQLIAMQLISQMLVLTLGVLLGKYTFTLRFITMFPQA